MNKAVEALYQAVQRIEAHTATMNAHLDLLRAGHRNARGNAALRGKLEGEIAYYTQQLGTLHAERDQLRREIKDLRG